MFLWQNWRIRAAGLIVILWIGYVLYGSSGQTAAPTVPLTPPAVPYYATPTKMDFCGEPVPLNVQDVSERLDREFTIMIHSRAQVYLWLKRVQRYFPAIEKQLAAAGLPDDLKYVAVAESDLMVNSNSPAGAAGPWQFIASTGMNYGLQQMKGIDERYDFELATASAFRYLRDLYGMFNNWTLAIAAYNCGEKRIQDEVRRQRIADYYSLKLPNETERYIFRILAIKEILSRAEIYGYSLPRGAGYPPIRGDRVTVQLPSAVPVQTAAEAAGITYREFRQLNPRLTSDTIPEGAHALKVPEGRGKDFGARVEALRASAKQNVLYHKVVKGDTVTAIAARYDIDAESLCEWNQIQEGRIQIDHVLKIFK
ncbi:MAG: transglycosylase SLT domain-containing protein [Syntrophobacteraceae bacterium]|nr:transglycosylase SLT domain-containing protein [Desulfobacteraceae bacterium]